MIFFLNYLVRHLYVAVVMQINYYYYYYYYLLRTISSRTSKSNRSCNHSLNDLNE